ncbi:MAG: hypothetical protein LBJ89_01590 [Holosporales bacterium]|jgi:hypothetical protein|nr:hypothetical protein [Holosporales bacterium]
MKETTMSCALAISLFFCGGSFSLEDVSNLPEAISAINGEMPGNSFYVLAPSAFFGDEDLNRYLEIMDYPDFFVTTNHDVHYCISWFNKSSMNSQDKYTYTGLCSEAFRHSVSLHFLQVKQLLDNFKEKHPYLISLWSACDPYGWDVPTVNTVVMRGKYRDPIENLIKQIKAISHE